MANDFLFELGCEELPSGSVWALADALANNVVSDFARRGLSHGKVHRFAAPRRLALWVEEVETVLPPQTVSRRGPACAVAKDSEGNPTQALLGFAKSCGVSVSELSTIQTDKGAWWAYEATTPGAHTAEVLPTIINDAVANLPIAKPMRWGLGESEFVRPVHWAVLLFGDEVIKTNILGVTTGRQSFGHRFHHPQAVELSSPSTYESLLKDVYVIADFAVRREMIINQITSLAEEYGYQAIMPEALVDEVTSIVEWPQALMANFESNFLEVPPEALIASMQSHQKCFALQDRQGHLLPHFITVANIESHQPSQVIAGNEKVMRARLSDAAFFYHQDKKQPLSDYEETTAAVIFQTRLGSLRDKSKRTQLLIDNLVHPLNLNPKQAHRAAFLAKCDLMTGMVGEFPELQGLMGYYYALHDGEDENVAEALKEQYKPRFAADELPGNPLGMALSLADRLDTLVGIFAIGQKPTGMKDPFKLRRHALAVVRILMTIPAKLNLSTLIASALHGYGEIFSPSEKEKVQELHLFILERLQSFYQNQGVPAELILAVRARQDDWLYDLDKRVKALQEFVYLKEAVSLSAACKRVNNLLQQAGIKLMDTPDEIRVELLEEGPEKVLFHHVQAIENTIAPLYSEGDYSQILNHLASLKEPVDAFFDHVMVMVDDSVIKNNRLNLLARLQNVLQGVADISLLQLGS